ncbi:hypothetical protein FOMPIDRAFT_1030677 [Fomitopsis schrenkii]|uniref:AB hydrolase-1 domain-containing protein n=1 Tax=Fomitopsis schrenkii TaxID=2126942 RepID=S8FNZ7_FOMSC|nr:hypothetical protein FOMPIDRAFT_1030677 [Fomitopsis schrenkii]
MSTRTGTVDFVVDSETFKTWYKVVGDLTCGVRPLVVVHGGPAFPHLYVRSHATLWETTGIPVILYDQLGCGESTHLREKPKEFWTFELFIAELENLVTKLGIQGGFDLLGHSWGGALAASYVLARQPRGLKRLVLTNTYASMRLDGTTDSTEYKEAELVFLRRHAITLDPMPADLQTTIAELEKDNTVYLAVHGPSEFYCTGNQKAFDVIDRLNEIKQPTLVINGMEDQATDLCTAPLFWKIPNAKWVQLAKATHLPFFEEPERYFEIVGNFLTA